MVIVLELVTYPQFTAMNVVALGGRDLRHMIKKFWKQVCGWAQVCGVKHIECLVAPAMEKILVAQGFERKYTLLRQSLTAFCGKILCPNFLIPPDTSFNEITGIIKTCYTV